MHGKDINLVATLNHKNELFIGELTHLKKLWMAKMTFKKQVTKCLPLPKDEFIIAIMEQPDFLYLDETK